MLLQEHIVYQAQPAWHVCQAQHALMLAQPLALRLPVVKTLALALPPLCLKARCAFPGVGYPNSPSRWDFVHSQAQCLHQTTELLLLQQSCNRKTCLFWRVCITCMAHLYRPEWLHCSHISARQLSCKQKCPSCSHFNESGLQTGSV